MGSMCSTIAKQPTKILLLGLDGAGNKNNSYTGKSWFFKCSLWYAGLIKIGCTLFLKGKTSLLYTLKGNNDPISPTVGFNVEIVESLEGVFFELFDVEGTKQVRQLWIHHIKNTKGNYSIS